MSTDAPHAARRLREVLAALASLNRIPASQRSDAQWRAAWAAVDEVLRETAGPIVDPIGAFGEVAPEDHHGVLSFVWRGRMLVERFTADFPHFTRDQIAAHVEAAWAYRGTLEGQRRRAWQWPAAAISRIDMWLRRATAEHLREMTLQARAEAAGAPMPATASPGISAAIRTRYMQLRAAGADLPPLHEFAKRPDDFKAPAPQYDERAPDLRKMMKERGGK